MKGYSQQEKKALMEVLKKRECFFEIILSSDLLNANYTLVALLQCYQRL
jgi:hypothetical protein